MIKVLEGINEIGEEVKCTECGSIIHVGNRDWKRVEYFVRSYCPQGHALRHNEAVDCPKCYCTVLRWEDKYVI